jgi:hypothetical protein
MQAPGGSFRDPKRSPHVGAETKEVSMRIFLALPLLLVAACDVQKDEANDTTSYEFNEQQVESTAANVGDTAKNVAADIGEAAENAGEAIKDKVDDIDVDVDVNRNSN